jgi:MYXO-CTERM domain-containing protein
MASSRVDAIAERRPLVYGRRVITSRHLVVLGALAAATIVPAPSRAHFVLQSPPAMTKQDALGDPQKAPPCGDNGNAEPTGTVTAYQAGDTITITIDETIFHPGHYRVALALNDPSELPEPPPVTPNDTPCGTAPIQSPPQFPVLADGIFVHTDSFSEPQSFDVKLPDDISCESCTLQVIQFMSNHGLNDPGGCYYHHCATISVAPAPAATTSDGGESSSDGGDTTESPATTGVTTGASTTSTTASTQGGTGGETSEGGTGPAGTSGDTNATGGATATGGETATGGSSKDDDGGCGCSGARGGDGPATLAVLLGLLGLRARRRR